MTQGGVYKEVVIDRQSGKMMPIVHQELKAIE